MKQHIKKILILFPLTLLLSGCFGGLSALSKLGKLGDAFHSFMGIFRVGRVSSQNPEGTGQVVFMILLIGGVVGAFYYFNKKQKGKPITKKTTATTIEAKQEKKPKETLTWDEPSKVEEKKVQPKQEEKSKKHWFFENFKDPTTPKVKAPNEQKQQETTIEIKKDKPKEKLSWDVSPKIEEKKVQSKQEKTKVKHWFFENFKDPTTLKVNASNEKNKQETKKVEPQEVKPKEILTWDEPAKPEPKKEEPVKEEPKPIEVTITPQEEEEIYEQVAKELQDNRNEGAWLKAFTENDGDKIKTKIAYTKKRVASLMEELKTNKSNKENKGL